MANPYMQGAVRPRDYGLLLDDVAADAGAAALTTEDMDVSDSGYLSVQVSHTNDSCTSISVAVWASVVENEAGQSYTVARLQSMMLDSGVATLSAYTPTKAVAGNDSFVLDLPVRGYTRVRLVFTLTNGVTADKISVWCRGATG